MQKASNILGLIKFIVIFFGTGVVLLVLGFYYTGIKNAPGLDIYDMKDSEFKKNAHVVTDIECIFGEFYSETEERSTYGITTSSRESARGYAIAFIEKDSEGYYVDRFLGMKLSNKDDYKIMDKMIEESDEWWYDEEGYKPSHFMKTTYHFDGKLVKMDDEEYNLMKNALGLSSSEAEEYIIPYMLVPMKSNGVIFFVVGAVFLAIGIVIVVVGKNQDKAARDAEAARAMYAREEVSINNQPMNPTQPATNDDLDFLKNQPAEPQGYAGPTEGIIVNGKPQDFNSWNQNQ